MAHRVKLGWCSLGAPKSLSFPKSTYFLTILLLQLGLFFHFGKFSPIPLTFKALLNYFLWWSPFNDQRLKVLIPSLWVYLMSLSFKWCIRYTRCKLFIDMGSPHQDSCSLGCTMSMAYLAQRHPCIRPLFMALDCSVSWQCVSNVIFSEGRKAREWDQCDSGTVAVFPHVIHSTFRKHIFWVLDLPGATWDDTGTLRVTRINKMSSLPSWVSYLSSHCLKLDMFCSFSRETEPRGD